MKTNHLIAGMLASVAVMTAGASAHAATAYYNWTWNDVAGDKGHGQFVVDDTVLGDGSMQIIGVTGTQHYGGGPTEAILGLSPYAGSNNHLHLPPVPGFRYFDFGGASYDTLGNSVNLSTIGDTLIRNLASQDPGGFGGSALPISFRLGSAGTTSGNAGAVPEPASWALMIMGFGGIGAMLRTRRNILTAA